MNRRFKASLLAVSICCLALPATAADATSSKGCALENDCVRLALDGQGHLAELVNRHTGWNYAGKRGVWRLFCRQGDQMEMEAVAGNQQPEIVCEASGVTVRYNTLETLRHEPLAISVTFSVRIQPGSDQTQWTVAVENRQSGVIVNEVQFPLVGDCQLQPEQPLIWSRLGGEKIAKPKAVVRSRHSLYRSPDQNGIKMSAIYPGVAAMNCFAFASEKEGLYFGSHDPDFLDTLHLFRLSGDDLEVGFVKYPFLGTGETFRSATFVVAPYVGDWHVAAKKYRDWSNTWFVPLEQPDWVRKMTGWQRVILKHQYGEVLRPYSAISQITSDGISAGVNSLSLFGWWKGGMDNGNPAYEFDEALGGRDALAAQIKNAQRQGVRVHLYYNGRLIDKESEFYRSGEASRVSMKDWRGNELVDSYLFGGDGTTVSQFGRKTFVVACPGSAEWQKRRFTWIDQALAVGVDAVFFDQLEMPEVPCTDPHHGHPTPWRDGNRVRVEKLKEIRQYIRSRNPQAAFGTEWLCDIFAAQVDYSQNVKGAFNPPGFTEWFRYTFPEIIFTDREAREDDDIERRLNLSLIRGVRSDVEIYRCRGTIADAPRYRQHLGQVNRLRTKYADFFLEGVFRDTEGFQIEGNKVEARAFLSGDRMLVAITQSAQPDTAVKLAVPGYRLVSTDGLGKYRAAPQQQHLDVTLNRHAVVVGVYQKQ
jgi:hypothetical protein